MRTQQLHLTVGMDVYEACVAEAQAQDVSGAEIIRRALRAYLRHRVVPIDADAITPEQVQALRPLMLQAYRGLSLVAVARHQLLGDSLEAGAAGDIPRAKAAMALHALLGPPARIEPAPDGGRWELVLADGTRGWSHEAVDDDDDQDGPDSPASPQAPAPAARQEQEQGAGAS